MYINVLCGSHLEILDHVHPPLDYNWWVYTYMVSLIAAVQAVVPLLKLQNFKFINGIYMFPEADGFRLIGYDSIHGYKPLER